MSALLIQCLRELDGWAFPSCAPDDYPELQKDRVSPEIAPRAVYYLKPSQNYAFGQSRTAFEQALFSYFPDRDPDN